MKVSIIGTGNMGSGFANQLVKAGHSVTVSGRDAAKAAALADASGAGIGNAASAAAADVIILATGFDTAVDALKSLGDLSGKIVVDVTNPLTTDYMGLTIGHSTSAAEQIAAAVPGVTLVKGFNTIFAQLLAAGPRLGDNQVPVFLASDDAAAKQVVSELARSIGFAVVDAGPLKNARYLEPLAGLNIYLGYGAGLDTAIAPAWLPLSA